MQFCDVMTMPFSQYLMSYNKSIVDGTMRVQALNTYSGAPQSWDISMPLMHVPFEDTHGESIAWTF